MNNKALFAVCSISTKRVVLVVKAVHEALQLVISSQSRPVSGAEDPSGPLFYQQALDLHH